MSALRQAFTQVLAELGALTEQTASITARLWPALVGFLLMGWAAFEGSILLGSELSLVAPWGVILVLAAGVVGQLATTLMVLRLVAVELDVPALLSTVTSGAGQDERDTSLLRLLTTTLVPFLGMYAAFGFVATFAQRVTLLSGVRKGFADLLEALNPLHSPLVLTVTLGVLAVGWVFGKLIDPWLERTRFPLALGLVRMIVEASLLLVVLLGGFRIFTAVRLWLEDRVVTSWWDGAALQLRNLLHVDLPAMIVAAWQWFSSVAWPVLIDGLSRPLLWLAMVGLVFGSRVLTLADLWRVGIPATVAQTRRERVLARLQADTDQARGLRLIVLKAQGVLGGVDSKIIPAWQSLRLVLRRGWPALAAFVIAFTLVDVASTQSANALTRLIGGHEVAFWLVVGPLTDLLDLVVFAAITWVLLTVAYSRALSAFAERGTAAEDVTGPLPSAAPSPRGRRLAATVSVGLAVAVVILASLTPSHPAPDLTRGQVGHIVELRDLRLAVDPPKLATSILLDGKEVETTGVFVVVPVAYSVPSPNGGSLEVELRRGERTYRPFGGGGLSAQAGFKAYQELVFELARDDIDQGARIYFTAPSGAFGFSAYGQAAEFDLGLDPSQVSAASSRFEVFTGVQRAAA